MLAICRRQRHIGFWALTILLSSCAIKTWKHGNVIVAFTMQTRAMLEHQYGGDFAVPRPTGNQCTDTDKMGRFIAFIHQNRPLKEMYRL